MNRSGVSALWATLVLAPAVCAAGAAPVAPAGGTIVGELTRVDLVRHALALKTEGRDAREVEAVVTDQTRFTSRGRASRLEDLRPGDRLAVMAVEEGGTRKARLVKVMGRAAIAPPSTHP